ncbi:MAG: hypothetical protein P4L53_11405 [Candidatus Obscuribacterales bacterium]|nr:hypothetical protein [Candidatus Obscuribacterales bacterium]
MQKITSRRAQFVTYFLMQSTLLLLFYFPFILGQKTFVFEDSTNFFEPLCSYIGRSLSEGRLPLWNPYSYCGMPQIAISSPSFCNPFSWLFVPFSYSQALGIILVLCQLVIGSGAFLLVQTLGWGGLPAALAGFVIGLSGYQFSLSSNYSLLTSAAWLPICFWLIHVLKKSPRSQHWRIEMLGLTFSVCMLVLGGRPEIWLPGLFLLVAFSIFYSDDSKPSNLLQSFVLIKTILIGMFLSSPCLLPALEWMPLSRRSEGLPEGESLLFSANWYHLLDMLISHPLGDLQVQFSKFRILIEPHNIEPYVGSAYVGAVAIALCLIGSGRRGRLFWCVCGTLGVATIACLGENMPGARAIVESVPILGALRFPSKLLFFVVLCISLLSARGLRDYLSGSAQLISSFVFGVMSIAAGLFLLVIPFVVLPFSHSDVLHGELALTAQRAIALGLCQSGGIVIIVLSTLRACAKNHRLIGASVALVVVVTNLMVHAWTFYRSGAEADYFCKQSVVSLRLHELNKLDSDFRESQRFVSLLVEKFSVPHAYSSSDPVEATNRSFQYSRSVLRGLSNIDFRIPSSFGFEGAMIGEYYYLFLNSYFASSQAIIERSESSAKSSLSPISDVPLARLLQLTATKYLVTPQSRYFDNKFQTVPRMNQEFFELVDDNLTANLRIYRVKHSLPRAYLSYSWRSVNTRDELIRKLASKDETMCELEKQSLLEAKIATVADRNEDKPLEQVRVVENTPERLSLQAMPLQPAILVLADQFYPGWHATIDGVEVPILRCNGFMRAVYVSPGTHEITYNYWPSSFYGGISVSLVSLLWLLLLIREDTKQIQN